MTNHAVAGAIFFELAGHRRQWHHIVARHLSSRFAMLWGAGLMLPSVFLVVAAEIVASTTILLLATAVCGAAAGLGYRGRMQVVNEIAPQDRRAAVMSGYFVCVYCGNALPVIGIGVISTLTSSLTATLIFAATVSLFALIALRLERADSCPNPVGRRGSGYRGICARAIRPTRVEPESIVMEKRRRPHNPSNQQM